MPSTGKAESAKTKKMLGQQVRTAIEALHAENEELKKDLARETRQANLTATMGKGQGSQAARLQEEADLYLKKIENERNKIATLDAKISQCKKEMTAQRQKMGGVNAGKENHDMLVKQIKLMEKKLDKALQKFNEALSQNKTLRGYIDSLHKERVVFDGIYKKLEYDLHKKKKEMAAIIEDSKNAQRRADRSQRSLDKLKQGMDDEKTAFEKEWADLGALMEQDRQLQEALRRKEREEHERKTAEALAASKKAEEDPYMSEDPEESEEEEEESPGKKKKVEEDRPKLTEEEVQEYQATFERITKATGIQTVEELVDTFQDIEQKNFSLFNSINELTTVHKSKIVAARFSAAAESWPPRHRRDAGSTAWRGGLSPLDSACAAAFVHPTHWLIRAQVEQRHRGHGIGDRRNEARDGEVQGPGGVYRYSKEARAQGARGEAREDDDGRRRVRAEAPGRVQDDWATEDRYTLHI